MMKFFIIVNHVQQGPYTIDELHQMHITSDTLVWADGMAQWTPAWRVMELRPILHDQNYAQPGAQTNYQASSQATPPPPPIQLEGETQPQGQPAPQVPLPGTGPAGAYESTSVRKKSHHALYWLLGILGMLLLVMIVTNPSESDHRQQLRQNVTEGMAQAIEEQMGESSFLPLGMITHMLAAPIIEQTLSSLTQYHNYVIFSTTSIYTSEGDVTVSYGCLGKVLTADKDKVAEAIATSNGMKTIKGLINGFSSHNNDEEALPAPDPSAGGEEPADSTSLTDQIGNAIADHVSKQVKKEIRQHTDSATSSAISSLVDKAIKLINGK
jgi:hypothetical protein